MRAGLIQSSTIASSIDRAMDPRILSQSITGPTNSSGTVSLECSSGSESTLKSYLAGLIYPEFGP